MRIEREPLSPDTEAFYRRALVALGDAGIPYLVGGAFALERYTGISRNTHDLDAFVAERHVEPALGVLAREGYRTDLLFPHWLGKAYRGLDELDVIFSSGNGVARVDALWFEHAVDGEVLGMPQRLVPVEEMIWSKGFVQERERYDGADIAHLLRARGDRLDWPRLLARFGPYWRVLFGHLVLYGFAYPNERDRIPRGVMRALCRRLRDELGPSGSEELLCQGTLLSREQYLMDIERWGYTDARLQPPGEISPEHIAIWTEAIAE